MLGINIGHDLDVRLRLPGLRHFTKKSFLAYVCTLNQRLYFNSNLVFCLTVALPRIFAQFLFLGWSECADLEGVDTALPL